MLEPGYYANLFEVQVPDYEIQLMVCERKKLPELKTLRNEISKAGKHIFVYALAYSDLVYGYGVDKSWLEAKGFEITSVKLYDEPRLTSRLVLDSFIESARELGYIPSFQGEIGRCKLFNWDKYQVTSDGNVRIFSGFDVRTVFLKDHEKDSLCFNIVIDSCFALRDVQNNRLNSRDIVSQFGSETLKEVRQIQGDLIPTGINTEVSRKRLYSEILPLLNHIKEITLPSGITAKVCEYPSRIVVGEGEEHDPLW